MKKILLPIFCVVFVANALSQTTISKDERVKALDHLKKTNSELIKTVKGLSKEQLNYKPSDESWSIEECMEHVAISENSIFGIVTMILKSEPDPSKRGEVNYSDDQMLGFIESREQKVKTRKEFEPTRKYGGFEGSFEEFKMRRKANMKYVKSSKDDLRNRYFDFPFGKVDAYQVILFMSGHTQRHIDQIKEVMTSEGFPTS